MTDNNRLMAIDSYYNLKNKYEKNLLNEKRKIFKNINLTKKEKKYKINQIKKCINCKKNGGTIFTNKKNILKAKCGSIGEKCDLNIEIKKGTYYNVNDLFIKYNKQFKNLIENILKLKLDYVFRYKDEDEINENFSTLKKNIKNLEENLNKIKEIYMNIINNENNKHKINLYNEKLVEEIKEINYLNNKFNEKDDNDYLMEIANKYKYTLIPLLNNIRNIKYKNNYVEYDDINDKYYLIQDLYTSIDLEIILDKFK